MERLVLRMLGPGDGSLEEVAEVFCMAMLAARAPPVEQRGQCAVAPEFFAALGGLGVGRRGVSSEHGCRGVAIVVANGLLPLSEADVPVVLLKASLVGGPTRQQRDVRLIAASEQRREL